MSKRLANLLIGLTVVALCGTVAAQNITIPNTFVNGTVADADQVNANFSALSSNALNRTAGIMSGTLTFSPDNTLDIGASGATRPRDLFLGRNATIGGTLGVTGVSTLAGATLTGHLLATDATFDIGASGATRFRDLFLSRNAVIGGTLGVTGAVTLSSTADVTGLVTLGSADSTVKIGASSETAKLGGIINTDSTSAATAANTTDTTLFTYSLPANALNADGRIIKFTAWGSFAANGNTKTVREKWNGIAATTMVSATATFNGVSWVATGYVIRTGASAQDVAGTMLIGADNARAATTTAAATDSGAITLSVTAQNGTAAANDIVYEGSIIEFLN